VLKYLSEGLLDELIWQKNHCILKNVVIFQKFSSSFIKKFFVSFKEELLGKNDQIFEEDGEFVVR
jgi:hypothetical protein